MTKFKVIQKLTQVVIQEFWEEFDTSDQSRWEALKESVKYSMDDDEFDELPDEAPEDEAVWFSLYQNLDCHEYANQEEDYWKSDIKGSTEYDYILENEDGEQIDRA